ncbi:MAG: hypothetical protein WAM39_05945 [Bryobacteraceae bacterium]
MIDKTDLLLKQHLYTVFGERDSAKRRAAIAVIWNHDGVFICRSGAFAGVNSIDRAIHSIQEQFPQFVCSELSAPECFHGIGRLAWGYGPPNKQPQITGLNVAVVSNNRLSALYTFFDPL